MRKPLSIDKNHDSIKIPNGESDGRNYIVTPEDCYF